MKKRLRPDLRIHVAAAEINFRESPDFSPRQMPPGFPDAPRSAAKRFAKSTSSQLRPFDEQYQVAPGVVVVAPAATPLGTAWSAWLPAASG